MKIMRFLSVVLCVALMGVFVSCDEKEEEKVVVPDDEEVVFPEITVDVPDQPSTPDTPPTPDPEPGPTSGVENGHAWVDLGTGVRWATMNVGANAPEGAGNYYGWGETETKENYMLANYAYGDEEGLYKYVNNSEYGYLGRKDDLTVLEATDDVAHVEWQGNWRMPTEEEIGNLATNCTWTESTDHKGYWVTGSTGERIFLLAAGGRSNGLFDYESIGYYWSSTLNESDPNKAMAMCLYIGGSKGWSSYKRYYGFSVRAVCPKD